MRVMRRYPGIWRTGCPFPVLSCTAWGFSCLGHCWPSGELLPRHFTFARRPLARPSSRMFSVTLSVAPRLRETRPRFFQGMLPSGVRTFLWRNLPASPAIICHREETITALKAGKQDLASAGALAGRDQSRFAPNESAQCVRKNFFSFARK